MFLTISLVTTSLLGGWLASTAWSWYQLRHIPGSVWISCSKLWQVVTQIRGRWDLKVRELGDRYGMLALVIRNPPYISILADNDVRGPLSCWSQPTHNDRY